MLEDRWREDLARRMNPGVEQTHEIILKDTVGQFQIETTRVSIGKCLLWYDTWTEDLVPNKKGKEAIARSHTEEEAENTHRKCVADFKSRPDST